MELKQNEIEFLQKYRKLSDHDKGYVAGMIESLNKKRQPKNFKLYEGKKARPGDPEPAAGQKKKREAGKWHTLKTV